MVKINKKTQGKKNRAAGIRFEARVRKDLESKGWIVDKWSNNVEFIERGLLWKVGKLIPAKRKYNPFKKVMAIGTGFPDFICFRKVTEDIIKKVERFLGGYVPSTANKIKEEFRKVCDSYEVIGVEAKSNGYLDLKERAKCKWLIENNVFSKVLVAHKGKKRGEIIYKEFDSKKP